MNNLKIRAKILLSFGIIVLLIMAAFTYVIIKNLVISGYSENMQSEFQLVELSNELMEHSSTVNAGLQVLSLSLDDDIYAEIVSNIEEGLEKMHEANALIDRDPSLAGFKDDFAAIEPVIDRWSADISKLHDVNMQIEHVIEAANESQLALTSMSMDIFNYQMELSREEAEQDVDSEARLRRVGRIEQGMDIANRLNSIGGAFEVMFKSLDTSDISGDMEFFNETVEILTEFLEGSSLQFNIDTATAMLEALEVYHGNINDFTELMDERSHLIASGTEDAHAVIEMVGALVADIDSATLASSAETVVSNQLTLWIVIGASAIMLAVSVILAINLSKSLSRPIVLISTFMRKAATSGDITLEPEDIENIGFLSKRKDEIGQLTVSTADFITHVTKLSNQLEMLAGGDLSADLEVLSDRDTIGISIRDLSDKLNKAFREITRASVEVTTGSKHVAIGAQSLAQGSTEQAATIEELSSSVADIASKTSDNAEMADKAASLANTIMGNAEKGSRQMDDMMKAVNDINEASQRIVNVIKVIEDIAFQTNILALNAAVEAARAGQHGKGFAVVAEEVRNLATKSSEAAKETGNLIADSSEKAQLGSRIATETSTSLAEIVDGIRESSELISRIAESSSVQTAEVNQINTGIDQVAHVVQTNSATAQQSAAASEEMSSQSSMLEAMVEQFKLRDDDAPKGLPPADAGYEEHPALPE